MRKKNRRLLGPLLAGIGIAPIFAPALMAFPYQQEVGAHHVYSVNPVTPQLVAQISEADNKVALSPSSSFRRSDQPIFLTGGGWRWTWLANTSGGAFALTRPINEAIIVNRVSAADNRVYNGASVGGQRGLSGVIAHEMTHGSIRAHFGLAADLIYPQALREGYCDYVAGGGSLTDQEARSLLQRGVSHPALPYWQGRKRIEIAMARPGASVDNLFKRWPSLKN